MIFAAPACANVLAQAALGASSSLVVLAVLWGLWEGWHWIGTRYDLTWPFAVNDVTMPHLHQIVQALFQPAQVNGPWLIDDPLARRRSSRRRRRRSAS